MVLSLPAAPAGYTVLPEAPVSYLSANNTTSTSSTVNASETSYRPVSGFSDGDRYVVIIMAQGTNCLLQSYQFFTNTPPSLVFPAPWAPGSLGVNRTAHPSISGLARSDSDLRAYTFTLQMPSGNYNAFLSKGWLGNTPSYTLPDLSDLLGYTPSPSGSDGVLAVAALLINKPQPVLNFNELISLAAGDYLRQSIAFTTSFTIGGGTVALP